MTPPTDLSSELAIISSQLQELQTMGIDVADRLIKWSVVVAVRSGSVTSEKLHQLLEGKTLTQQWRTVRAFLPDDSFQTLQAILQGFIDEEKASW